MSKLVLMQLLQDVDAKLFKFQFAKIRFFGLRGLDNEDIETGGFSKDNLDSDLTHALGQDTSWYASWMSCIGYMATEPSRWFDGT